MVFRYGVVHRHGNVLIDGLSDGIVLIILLGLGNVLSVVVRLFNSLSDVLVLNFSLGDVVTFGLITSLGDKVGHGVALGDGLSNVHTLGLGEVDRGGIITILALCHVNWHSDHLGIIEDLSFSEDLWLSICCHGGIKNDGLGSHLSLSDVRVDGCGNLLGLGLVVHGRSLDIFCHGTPDLLGVAPLGWCSIGLGGRTIAGSRSWSGGAIGRLDLNEASLVSHHGSDQSKRPHDMPEHLYCTVARLYALSCSRD